MIYLSKLAKRLALAGPHARLLLVLSLAGACSTPEEKEFLNPNPSQPVPVISLSVQPKIGSVKPGEVIQFTATAKNAKGAVVVADVDWSSTDGRIDSTGAFYSEEFGNFQVKATLRSNSLIADSARVGVFVNPKDVLKLSITPDASEVTEGEGVQINATAELADGSVEDQPALAWSADVGQIDGSGYFIAPELEGTYVVRALAASGVTGQANVSVKPNKRVLERIEVSPGTATLGSGQTQQFVANGIYEDGYTKVTSVSWSSTGGTISGDGTFTAGGTAGNYRVIARYKGGAQADTAFVSITEPDIIGLDVTPNGSSLTVGATQQYTATARLSDGTAKEVGASWEATGGTISQAGLYSATTDGNFTVRASIAGTSLQSEASVNVTAAAATLTKVTLSPSSATVPVGTGRQFSVTGTYSDGTTKTPSVIWSSTGGNISSSGYYTAGTVLGTFRVIAASGTKADTSAITITSADLTSLSISPSSTTLAPGGTQQFTASGTWSNGSTTTPVVTWSSTGGNISMGGVYTAGTTSGTYRVIGTHSGGRADTSLVTISAPAPALLSLSLTPSSVSLAPGGTRQFSVSGSWSDGGTSAPPVTYLATGGSVTTGGLYTAGTTTGTFRLIAKHSGGTKADTSTITIASSAPTLQSLSLTPATTSLQTGGTRQFTVAATWSDGSTAAPALTWTTTGGTVSGSGLYTAPATAGTYKVFVKATGGTKADTSVVTVTAPATITDLTVSPGNKSLSVGSTQQFAATATYSNGGTGTATTSWSATGGTISSGGLYSAGTTTGNFRVIATASGTNVKDTAEVSLTTVTEPPPPTGGDVLFVDDFRLGRYGPSQNGVSWGLANVSVDDKVSVQPDPASPSGYSLAITYKGNTSITDDGWAEQTFKLPQMREVFICMVIATPANYVHRDANPDNNKLLRLWDADYRNSTVHLGMSTLYKPNSSPGNSQMIVEYDKVGVTGTGNYSTGPWNIVFRPGTVDTVGFYAKPATSTTSWDGVIKVWWNNKLVYTQTTLGTTQADNGMNYFSNGYLFGWANSGFTETTTMRLRKFLVARTPTSC